MATINEKIEYCVKCGKQKFHIAFKPDTDIKLQCLYCDKPIT